MSMVWRFQAFDALTVAELYAVLRLRSEVFVVEQNCVFLDMDNSDAQAMHVLGHAPEGAGELVAYARCFGPGVKYAEASIGRVVTAPSARGSGVGHVLMREAVRALHGLSCSRRFYRSDSAPCNKKGADSFQADHGKEDRLLQGWH